MLLLEYVEEDGSRQRKSYLLSDLNQSIGDMPPSAREWIISVLTDISGAQFDPHLSTDEMFSWYSFWMWDLCEQPALDLSAVLV